jgi:hypothetical protein
MNTQSEVSYCQLFWQDDNFREYAKLSIGTSHEYYFKTTLKMPKKDTRKMDKACRFIWDQLTQSCTYFGTRDPRRSFMVSVYQLQTDDDRMAQFVDKLPEILRDKREKMTLFHRLLVDFIADLFQLEFIRTLDYLIENEEALDEEPKSLEEITTEYSKKMSDQWKVEPVAISNEDEKCEVQFFFGYALGKAKNKFPNSPTVQSALAQMSIPKEALMQRPEAEIVLVFPRLVRCRYDRRLALKRGKQTLVSPEAFPFGLTLMSAIRALFNQKSIKKNGNWSAIEAWEELVKVDELWDEFDNAIKSVGSTKGNCDASEELINLYRCLAQEAFTARAGAEIEKFKEENTKRNADKAVDTSLRTGLKVSAKKRKVEPQSIQSEEPKQSEN